MLSFCAMIAEEPLDVVGFTVYTVENAYYDDGELIVFTNVTSNIGGHFQPATSSFLCPVTGVYYFSLSIANINSNYGVNAHITKEELILVSAHSRPDGATHSATAAVTTCERGQSVWIQASGDNRGVYGNPDLLLSSFSGFLLYVV